MNTRNTWYWLIVAAIMFGAILLHERFARKPVGGPAKVLPTLKAATATSIQVQLKGQDLISAERTNGTWQLAGAAPYPAQTANIEGLLATLERLTPATIITARERRSQPRMDEEQGFVPTPQATIRILQGDSRETIGPLDIGVRTAPGDQLYVQVAGRTETYVVDAELLKEIPRTKDDWRDTALADLRRLVYDHIAVTNGGKAKLELQFESGNNVWRIVNPPWKARADASRIGNLLQQLQGLRVSQFVSDKPDADLESFGLQPPELEVALARGTNALALLQFGKSPTNAPGMVYARCWGRTAIVTVATNALAGWQEPADAFRNPHVVELPESISAIEVQGPGTNAFSVQRQGTNAWRVLPGNLPADTNAVQSLLEGVSSLPILEVNDNVIDTEPELAKYGLAAPARKYFFKTAAVPGATNALFAEVDFGTNESKVFVRRADEKSVYAVKLANPALLSAAGFQLRDRRIWSYSDDDIVRASVRQSGKVRQLVHPDKGLHTWALAPGSEGAIETLAVGTTMRYLSRLTTTNWVAHGEQSRARYGFAENGRQLTLELKNGEKLVVDLGGASPSKSIYGAVTLDGEPWIFEFDPRLAELIQSYLLPWP